MTKREDLQMQRGRQTKGNEGKEEKEERRGRRKGGRGEERERKEGEEGGKKKLKETIEVCLQRQKVYMSGKDVEKKQERERQIEHI